MLKKTLSLCLLLITINSYAQMDTTSYSIGVIIAQNLKQQQVDQVDSKSVADGIADVINGNELKISVEEANQIFGAYVQAQQAKEFEGNKTAGENFLLQNAAKEGVQITDSGLQYEILKPGTGENATLANTVKVHYHGTLIDGTVFDSSVERAEPISFPLTNVIQGWQEGLALMNTGAKYRLYIPYHLAYGERGAGKLIGPYSALIFDVELIEIQ